MIYTLIRLDSIVFHGSTGAWLLTNGLLDVLLNALTDAPTEDYSALVLPCSD